MEIYVVHYQEWDSYEILYVGLDLQEAKRTMFLQDKLKVEHHNLDRKYFSVWKDSLPVSGEFDMCQKEFRKWLDENGR